MKFPLWRENNLIGYADQFGGPKGKKFKYKSFENLLLSIQEKTMTEQREILNDTIDKWRG